MSREQINEIQDGLLRSAYPFLPMVKDKRVDKEDTDSLNEVLGDELMEKIKDKGLVVKQWENQVEILGHPAVGGLFSHCGWNLVTEAAWHGVRLLVWPAKRDQKVKATVVERSGLDVWPKTWEWGLETVVKREKIGEKIKQMMGSEELKLRAKQIQEEVRKAVSAGGSSNIALSEVIDEWSNVEATM
ncbi:UDP-glycosyltransferase 13-like [Manihot esculenta]|uniref:UDP-glycosyltransferase 13-like n=1 Tax=Manihot esculenta TaxID=3983 RepID=UPI000B5D44EE|nr:UDP-glycosyltransferase 13-like [Manihot esculenta]